MKKHRENTQGGIKITPEQVVSGLQRAVEVSKQFIVVEDAPYGKLALVCGSNGIDPEVLETVRAAISARYGRVTLRPLKNKLVLEWGTK